MPKASFHGLAVQRDTVPGQQKWQGDPVSPSREETMKPLFLILAAFAALSCTETSAEMNGTTRIGVMNDMSSVYADFQGPGSVGAAQLAVEDFARQSKRKVEVLSADHQNKPDIGSATAGRWFDTEGVDMIIDLPNSAVALAVADVARDRNKVVVGSGAGTALLTGAKCSPNTVHWTYDTWTNGHALARGGKILGSVRHPIGTNDFSSLLLQAQASKAHVVALANAGGDTVNTIKQAAEFKIRDKQKLVALIFDLQSVPALGLATAQGL